MGDLSLMLFVGFAVPLLISLFICRDGARTSVLFLFFGMLICMFCGALNAALLGVLKLDVEYFACNVSPLTEEVCKAVPVLLFTFLYKPPKRQLLECAMLTGVGFAILENAHCIAANPKSFQLINALVRGFSCGIMHAVCTLFVGYGMTFVYTRRKLFYTGTIALLAFATVLHSIYNTLVQSDHNFIGLLLPVLIFIPLALLLNKKS